MNHPRSRRVLHVVNPGVFKQDCRSGAFDDPFRSLENFEFSSFDIDLDERHVKVSGEDIVKSLDLDIERLWCGLNGVRLGSETAPSRQFWNILKAPAASPVAQSAIENVRARELFA